MRMGDGKTYYITPLTARPSGPGDDEEVPLILLCLSDR